jgi:hypothetical protein
MFVVMPVEEAWNVPCEFLKESRFAPGKIAFLAITNDGQDRKNCEAESWQESGIGNQGWARLQPDS